MVVASMKFLALSTVVAMGASQPTPGWRKHIQQDSVRIAECNTDMLARYGPVADECIEFMGSDPRDGKTTACGQLLVVGDRPRTGGEVERWKAIGNARGNDWLFDGSGLGRI